MSGPLTDAQQAIRQSACEFADEFLEPIAADLDRTGVFPRALIAQLATRNFLGLLLGRDLAPAGGCVSHVEVVAALSQFCPAVASILNNHALTGHGIARWGSDAQKKTYLSKLATGGTLAALAIHEQGPGLGVGPDAVMVTRQAGKYVLAGIKAFVRNAGVADIYLVIASAAPVDGKSEQTAFIVDATTVGLAVGTRLATMGLRGCPVAHLMFNDVTVGPDAVLGGEGGGAGIVEHLMTVHAVAEAAQTVAIGRAAVKHAAAYAGHRVQFGHPVGGLEAIQTLLADVATDTHMAWLGVQNAARLLDLGEAATVDAAMVKSFLGRCGPRMLIDTIQVEGGMGISETVPPHITLSLPLARMFRDIAGTTLLDAPADFPDKIIAASLA